MKPTWRSFSVINVLLTCGFVYLIWLSIEAYSEGRASADWPLLPCEILSSEVIESSPGGESSTTSYSVGVRYRYAVAGRTYESDRYQAAQSLDQARATAIVNSLPPGTRTECRVDPDDPTKAVLVAGGDQPVCCFWLFVALLFVALPVAAMAFVELRDRMARRHSAS